MSNHRPIAWRITWPNRKPSRWRDPPARKLKPSDGHGARIEYAFAAPATPAVPLADVLRFIDALATDVNGLRHVYLQSRSGTMVAIPDFHLAAQAHAAGGTP